MPLFLLAHELEDYTLNILHEMMTKNGFYLPTLSCHWLTKKVMLSIVQGNIYCPMFKDIRPLPCPRPPYRIHLISEINKEIE